MMMNIMWLFLWLMMIIIDDDGRCWYKLDDHNDNAFNGDDHNDNAFNGDDHNDNAFNGDNHNDNAFNGDDEPCWQYMSSSMYVYMYACMVVSCMYVCL